MKIPIIHLHGRLGFLAWQGKPARPYFHKFDKTDLQAAVEGIKIIHEDITDGRDKDFSTAKALMAEAEQVLFMGFGFNQTNIERLGIRELPRVAMSTAVGFVNQEKVRVLQACGSKVEFRGGDCINFLREELQWS